MESKGPVQIIFGGVKFEALDIKISNKWSSNWNNVKPGLIEATSFTLEGEFEWADGAGCESLKHLIGYGASACMPVPGPFAQATLDTAAAEFWTRLAAHSQRYPKRLYRPLKVVIDRYKASIHMPHGVLDILRRNYATDEQFRAAVWRHAKERAAIWEAAKGVKS